MFRATAALLATGLLVAAGTAEAATRSACLTAGRTIAANDQARLFRTGETPDGLAWDTTVRVCWRATRRITTLGTFDLNGSGPALPVLSGKWVAYSREVCDPKEGVCWGSVSVRSAQTGRRLRSSGTQNGPIARLVLTPHGSVAWVRWRPTSPTTATTSVYALDERGVAVLDEGPVDFASLGITSPTVPPHEREPEASQVYWTHDGAPRTAALP
jgi:hypothetical protein